VNKNQYGNRQFFQHYPDLFVYYSTLCFEAKQRASKRTVPLLGEHDITVILILLQADTKKPVQKKAEDDFSITYRLFSFIPRTVRQGWSK